MQLNLTPLAKRKHAAFILAADAKFFTESGFFQPGVNVIDESIWMLAIQSHLVIRERMPLESNPRYRQLVPYVLLRQKQEDGSFKYFNYQRMKGVGESRLAGNYSIGIGGHIELNDIAYYNDSFSSPYVNAVSLGETLRQNINRELVEEFGLFASFQPDYVRGPGDAAWPISSYGVLLDDTNEVGTVHAALIYMVDVGAELNDLTSAESELEARGFDTAVNLLANEQMESWSKHILEHLVAVEAKASTVEEVDQQPV